jgi:hypothetical protein
MIKAMNPTAPIATEAEAEAAARSSAISIFIGVLFAIFSVIYLVTNPQDLSAAMAEQGLSGAEAEAAAAMGAQLGLWSAIGFGVIQLIFGLVQWKNPKKFIAILFIVLLVLGLVSTLATPLMAGMPGAVAVPIWLTVFTLVVYAIQLILHFAGLRGMNKLDALQIDAAR